jgi:hypothetical protein
MMKILFLCLMLSFGWWVLMRWCVMGSLKVDWDNDDCLVIHLFGSFRNYLLKTLPSTGKKDTGKCIEGKRKSTTTSQEQWKSSFLPNNDTAGDLLEFNCHCYLCGANDRENDGPRGPQPPVMNIPLWLDNWQAPTSNWGKESLLATVSPVHTLVHIEHTLVLNNLCH